MYKFCILNYKTWLIEIQEYLNTKVGIFCLWIGRISIFNLSVPNQSQYRFIITSILKENNVGGLTIHDFQVIKTAWYYC